MSVGENIKRIRTQHDMTQEELGKIAGVSAMAVSQWENGRAVPRMGAVQRIADHFGMKNGEVIDGVMPETAPAVPGAITIQPSPVAYLPVLGNIHAGAAEEPDVYSEETHQVPAWVAEEHPRAFLLKVSGDCMDRVYPEGCLAVVDPDAEAVSGCVAAVQIDDTDFLMRRYIRTADTLVLSPDSFNPAHRDRVFSGDDWDDHFVRVVGRVVWYMCDGEM